MEGGGREWGNGGREGGGRGWGNGGREGMGEWREGMEEGGGG